ncbi:hypothetical protein [Enterobacter hormaechei]|uniref:tail fiber/spike domain-containing protein n=1 Tax=Enterobacter hormaechei TaxID=158836 RepID=UPI00301E1C9F
MSTQPTNLPVPSESPRDLKFNVGKVDEFVTSQNHTYTDRFGVQHWTISGIEYTASQAISKFGYITLDSFEDGNTLTLPNQVLRFEATGEYYRWDGVFPKDVPVGSTPETTGGVGIGAWISVGDASLRTDIENGYLNPKYSRVYQTVADMKAGNLKVGDNVTWNGYYAAGDGGGNSGIVVSGTLVADGGSVFALNNGLYVSAEFNFIEPAKFGASPSRTSAQNSISFNNAIAYALKTKKKIQHYVNGTYNIEPLSIAGQLIYDWFYWEAPRGGVTLICTNVNTPAVSLTGTSTDVSGGYDSFQYITVKGLRISSPYCCLLTRYTEHLNLDGLILVGGGVGIWQAPEGNSQDIKPRIENIIFSGCKSAYRSGYLNNCRVADAIFRNWRALNCGTSDGDWVYDFGYLDGALIDKIETYTDANVIPRMNGISIIKPNLVSMQNCNVFEVNGIGIRIASPRNTVIDDTTTIWGVGETQIDPAIRLESYSSISSANSKIRPKIINNYGPGIVCVGCSNIDFSGVSLIDNHRGSSGVGLALQNSQSCKMHNAIIKTSNPNGTSAISLDNSNMEILSIDSSGYSSHATRSNGGTLNIIHGSKTSITTTALQLGAFDDDVMYNATSGSASVALPNAAMCPGKVVRVTKTDASANGVAVVPLSGSGQTINGTSVRSLATQYKTETYKSDGTNWVAF